MQRKIPSPTCGRGLGWCAGHGANVGGESPLWADSNWSTSCEQGCPPWGGIWRKLKANQGGNEQKLDGRL